MNKPWAVLDDRDGLAEKLRTQYEREMPSRAGASGQKLTTGVA
jgi:hypothetical protein